MKKLIIYCVVLLTVSISCSTEPDQETISGFTANECEQEAIDNGHVFFEENKKMLYGGKNDEWHFDITHWSLRECQLNYGLGREYFNALIEPQYRSVNDNASSYQQNSRVIILKTEGQYKVYPIQLLQQHEVINEVSDGEPVMVIYCILADLAAVYSRTYCDTTFTFALSGYTYWDNDVWNGINAFVLWDRETESLWWPLIDQAVSGKMQDTWLEKHDESKWWETTWGDVVQNYPGAVVLKSGQIMEVPTNWPRYNEVNCN